MNNNWKNTDPRYDINKYDNIVILRPSLNGYLEAATARVDSKETWCIFTDFDTHSFISADDDWDEAWLWIRAPAH